MSAKYKIALIILLSPMAAKAQIDPVSLDFGPADGGGFASSIDFSGDLAGSQFDIPAQPIEEPLADEISIPDFFGPSPAPIPRLRFLKAPESEDAGPALTIGRSSIRVLVDGQEFLAQSLNLIAQAKTSLDLDMFIIDNQALVDALAARAKDIPVRVVADPFRGASPSRIARKMRFLRELRRAGADVVFYPTGELTGARFKIDHAKILIADKNRAVAGGTNWLRNPRENHDYNIRVEGEAVERLNQIFDDAWDRANKIDPPRRPPASLDPEDGIQVLLTDAQRKEPLEAFLYYIGKAKRIRAEEYLLNEPRVMAALISAHERGADIEIILDSNSAFLGGVNAQSAQRLLRAGISVRFFKDPGGIQRRLHAKLAVFDDETVIVGSVNWSRHALEVNHEIGLLFKSRAAAAELENNFRMDWKGRSQIPDPARGIKKLIMRVAGAVAGIFV
ncbi:MAG: phospholipase D-like domain-containing protein [Elusimicrobiota bacterium]